MIKKLLLMFALVGMIMFAAGCSTDGYEEPTNMIEEEPVDAIEQEPVDGEESDGTED